MASRVLSPAGNVDCLSQISRDARDARVPETPSPIRQTPPMPTFKRFNDTIRVALIADVPNWAYARIAEQLLRHLPGHIKCQLYYHHDYDVWNKDATQTFSDLLAQLQDQRTDIVHFFWRDAIGRFYDVCGKSLIPTFDSMAITSAVYDHLWLEPKDAPEHYELFNILIAGYVVSSRILHDAYSNLPYYPKPDAVIEDGVDLEFFQPRNLERIRRNDRPLRVGWTGNSTWGQYIAPIDFKGLETIIKPAVESLRSSGVAVEGCYHDRNDNWLPWEEMPKYFNTLDVYVCASLIEGTATPVLEAMACGLPIVSTRVGIVPQLFGPLQSQFLLQERTPKAVEAALRRLAENPELRWAISQENLSRIQQWSWKETAAKYARFFEKIFQDLRGETGRCHKGLKCLRKSYIERPTANEDANAELRSELEQVYAAYHQLQRRRSVVLATRMASLGRKLLGQRCG